MDRHPVTCANFSSYLSRSRYSPPDASSFLQGWARSGPSAGTYTYTYPQGHASKPVTHVSYREATAYCAAHGKRLPHAWEWQLAGQGASDGRPYPWGDQPDEGGFRMPKLQDGGPNHTMPTLPDVGAHSPQGDSPYGVADLLGTVWQMTDSFADRHTRGLLVKGGSDYRPAGSNWYFPQVRLSLRSHPPIPTSV